MAGTGAHALGLVPHAPSFSPVLHDERSSSTVSSLVLLVSSLMRESENSTAKSHRYVALCSRG
jgi:hypothetical protein